MIHSPRVDDERRGVRERRRRGCDPFSSSRLLDQSLLSFLHCLVALGTHPPSFVFDLSHTTHSPFRFPHEQRIPAATGTTVTVVYESAAATIPAPDVVGTTEWWPSTTTSTSVSESDVQSVFVIVVVWCCCCIVVEPARIINDATTSTAVGSSHCCERFVLLIKWATTTATGTTRCQHQHAVVGDSSCSCGNKYEQHRQ